MLICMTPHLYQSPFRLLRDPDPRANHLAHLESTGNPVVFNPLELLFQKLSLLIT